jgi:hypothetical protein
MGKLLAYIMASKLLSMEKIPSLQDTIRPSGISRGIAIIGFIYWSGGTRRSGRVSLLRLVGLIGRGGCRFFVFTLT